MTSTRSVLIVVHDYPPIRSAGTERALKFSQYLPEFGYQPVILTTGRYGGLPDDLENDVHRASDLTHSVFSPLRRRKAAGVAAEEQVRIATVANESALGRLRDAVMIPDTKIGWRIPAVRLGRVLIAASRPDVLFSSSPPETTHLIAGDLARTTGVPWVADLRDGWLFEPPVPRLREGRTRRTIEGRMERMMASTAAAVVSVTDPITDDLRARYRGIIRRAVTISNGYDAADFAGLERRRAADGTFRLTYTGAFSGSSAGRSAGGLFAAAGRILREDPNTPLRLEIVGPVTEQERELAGTTGIGSIVTFVPPVSRQAGIPAPGRRGCAAACHGIGGAQRCDVQALRLHRRGPAYPCAGGGQRGGRNGAALWPWRHGGA